jgi:hypothetical protein
MRILVQPEQLRQNARILHQGREFWQAQAARLRSLLAGLDWEIRQKANVDAQVQEAIRLAEHLAARSGESAAFLETAAARFEQADAEGVRALGTVLGASTLEAVFAPLAARFPDAAGPLWRLGTLFGGGGLPSTRLLPISGGITGVGFFVSLAWLGSTVRGLAEQIWAWLQGRPPEILSPLPAEGQPAIPKGQLARTILSGLERARREQEQKQATPSGRVVQTIEVGTPKERAEAPPAYTIYHPVSPQSQGERYGRAACLPTAASMILEYYHSQNPAHRAASPDDLIGMLDSGDGTPGKGVTLDKLNDDLGELGYTATTRTGSLEDLGNLLREGPVIANIKVDLIGTPGNGDIRMGPSVHHSVVVKGMSADAVIINDPWSGKEKAIERTTFEQMWREGGNYMVIIRPQSAP